MLSLQKLSKSNKNSLKHPYKMSEQTLQIFGVGVNSTELVEVLGFVRKKLTSKEKFWIATPNPEMIVLAQTDFEFRKVLNSADLSIPDGIGLVWAAKILGIHGFKERITGADLMVKLCEMAAEEKWKVVFLGGVHNIAAKALETLQKHYPGLNGLALSGPQELVISNQELVIGDEDRNKMAIKKINQFAPDLIFVGFGMGKQERWIAEFLEGLTVGGAMVIGGAFDFFAGKARRAPFWIRNLGLEWFWRLILEPWRWRRQISLIKFVWLVLKEYLYSFFS